MRLAEGTQTVDVIVSLLHEPINHLLESNACLNLQPKIAALTGQMTHSLTDAGKTKGLNISLEPTNAGLTLIAPAPSHLLIEVKFQATASVNVSAIPLQ